jgi:hypothetical protein
VESGGPLVGKVGGVVCRKSAPPRLYPPPVSVKDQWVDPHEQVLNVLTAYQRYEPDKQSSLLSIYA